MAVTGQSNGSERLGSLHYKARSGACIFLAHFTGRWQPGCANKTSLRRRCLVGSKDDLKGGGNIRYTEKPKEGDKVCSSKCSRGREIVAKT